MTTYGNLQNDRSQRKALEDLLAGTVPLPAGWAGDGSVPRLVAEKLAETVSVKDFGAVGDGVTDDLSAFTLAIASGKSVYVPPGLYGVSDTVDLTDFTGRCFEGAGSGQSRIRRLNKTGAVMMVGGARMLISGLEVGFDPDDPPTSSNTNAVGIKVSGTLTKSIIDNMVIRATYNGLDLSTSAGHNCRFTNIDFNGFVNSGFNKDSSGGYTQCSLDNLYFQNQNFGKTRATGNLADVGSTTSITLDASASSVDDYYNGARIYVTSTKLAWIVDYVGSTKVATLAAAPKLISDWSDTTFSTGNSYVIDVLSETTGYPFLLQSFTDCRIGVMAAEWMTLPTTVVAPFQFSACNIVTVDGLRFEEVIWKANNGATVLASGATQVDIRSLQGNYSALANGFGPTLWYVTRTSAQAIIKALQIDLRAMLVSSVTVRHAKATGTRTTAPYGGSYYGTIALDSSIAPDPVQVNGTTYDNAGPAGQGAIRRLTLEASKAWDIGSVAAAGTATTTVTVTGASRGDRVRASHSIDLAGMLMTSQVTASNTVTVTLYNPTVSPIDPASGTLYVEVDKL